MALIVRPGPFPVVDGERLTVEADLQAFVNGTVVTNIGRAQVQNSEVLEFVSSQTDAPDSPGRGTLWFKRGEGRLYSWHLNPTGATGGRWIAISDRRERLVHTKNGCAAGEVLWLGPESEEEPIVEGRDGRFPMTMESLEDNSATTRALYIPPFVVSTTEAAAGTFVRCVESGFVDALFNAATPTTDIRFVGKIQPDETGNLDVLDTGWTHDNDRIGLGYLAASLTSVAADQLLEIFFFGDGTNLTV